MTALYFPPIGRTQLDRVKLYKGKALSTRANAETHSTLIGLPAPLSDSVEVFARLSKRSHIRDEYEAELKILQSENRKYGGASKPQPERKPDDHCVPATCDPVCGDPNPPVVPVRVPTNSTPVRTEPVSNPEGVSGLAGELVATDSAGVSQSPQPTPPKDPPIDRCGTEEDRRAGRVVPWWQKPVFPDCAYKGDQGERIKQARIKLWILLGDELRELDEKLERCGRPNAGGDDWWLDIYEARVESAQHKIQWAKEDAEKAEAKARELATPKPRTMAQAAYGQIDAEIQKSFSLEQFSERFALIDPLNQEAVLDLRDDLLDEIDANEIRAVAYEGPSLAAGAALVKIVTARQERKRRAREAKQAPSPTETKIIVAAAVVRTSLPLRQDGNPQHQKLYHEQLWRERAGNKAKRIGSSTSMSQSAYETEGGATRKDLKAAIDAFPKPKGKPGKDSS